MSAEFCSNQGAMPPVLSSNECDTLFEADMLKRTVSGLSECVRSVLHDSGIRRSIMFPSSILYPEDTPDVRSPGLNAAGPEYFKDLGLDRRFGPILKSGGKYSPDYFFSCLWNIQKRFIS